MCLCPDGHCKQITCASLSTNGDLPSLVFCRQPRAFGDTPSINLGWSFHVDCQSLWKDTNPRAEKFPVGENGRPGRSFSLYLYLARLFGDGLQTISNVRAMRIRGNNRRWVSMQAFLHNCQTAFGNGGREGYSTHSLWHPAGEVASLPFHPIDRSVLVASSPPIEQKCLL